MERVNIPNKAREESKSTIFYSNMGNLCEKFCQPQTTANHLGSALGNRSITHHWVLWLELKEG